MRFGEWLCRHGFHAWRVVGDVEICARCGLESPGEYWQM